MFSIDNNERYSSILYNSKDEKLLAFKQDCTPVYFSNSFEKMIVLQGVPLAPKTQEKYPELRGRAVIYPPSESIICNKASFNKELFKKAVEEWFSRRLEGEGYKYIIN